MDSRMIDVAIGLVLVFALTSLAVTALHEAFASMRKLRGRNLEIAIRSMLGEGAAADGGLAASLMTHPMIVSLKDTPMIGTGKPSYIGSDVFITTLLARLAEIYTAGVRPDTPQALVAAVKLGRGKVSGVPEPQEDFVAGLSTLLTGVEGDWAAYQRRLVAWYDAVGERSIGWFKRATQMRLFAIGFFLAALVNVNPLVIAPRLWNDEALRKATVQVADAAVSAFSDAASQPSSADLLMRVLASGKPPTTDTAASASALLAVQVEFDARLKALRRELEAVITAGLQKERVDTLARLTELLDKIGEIELQVRVMRSAAVAKDHDEKTISAEFVDAKLKDLRETVKGLSLTASASSRLAAALDAVDKAKAAELKRLSPAPKDPGSLQCPALSDSDRKRECEEVVALTAGLTRLGLPIGWTYASLPDCTEGPCILRDANLAMKSETKPPLPTRAEFWAFGSCMTDWTCAFKSLAGWIAIALASTLGAPFWFDLLARLVKLRGSGSRPADEAVAKPKGPDVEAAGMLAGTPPTPPPTDDSMAMRDVQTHAEAQLTPTRVIELQRALEADGAKTTGIFDDKTREAINRWQARNSFVVTGELTQAQIELLLSGSPSAPAAPAAGAASGAPDHDHDGDCGVGTSIATPDAALPEARGGVMP